MTSVLLSHLPNMYNWYINRPPDFFSIIRLNVRLTITHDSMIGTQEGWSITHCVACDGRNEYTDSQSMLSHTSDGGTIYWRHSCRRVDIIGDSLQLQGSSTARTPLTPEWLMKSPQSSRAKIANRLQSFWGCSAVLAAQCKDHETWYVDALMLEAISELWENYLVF